MTAGTAPAPEKESMSIFEDSGHLLAFNAADFQGGDGLLV